MLRDKTEVRKDGTRTIQQGCNSGRDPTLLEPTECAWASNVSFRGGYPTNRQKFVQVALTDGGSSGGATSGLAGFQSGMFQGAGIYDIDDGQDYIMAMVSGTLYQLSVASGITVKGVFADGTSNANAPQVWMCQPDVYFVIQDGTSTPIVMQGLSTIRRAGATEVPVGRQMAYGQGRLWVAQNRLIKAGDIFGGPTSVISFTETSYLAEAAYFGVPLSAGTIVGMTFIEQGDTATGQGELLFWARNSSFSIQAGVPRAATQTQPGWQGTPNMQRVALTNIGGTGQRNLVNVNSDVFFRSKDGWRTYRTARNEAYGWGFAPISMEMNRVLDADALHWLDYASSAYFKKRVLLTAEGAAYKNQGAAMFSQIVVLDLDIISATINKSNLAYEFSPFFSQRGSPAYDGVWSLPGGRYVIQILSGLFNYVERCFLFCYNPANQLNEIWELVDQEIYDYNQTPVTSQIETKAYDFKLPDAIKQIRRGDLYFLGVQGSINVTVEYRSDGYPFWVPWVANLQLTGQKIPCNLDVAACQPPGCPAPGYWFRTSLPTPDDSCDINTGKLFKNGFYFQCRITWEGPGTLLMFVLHATELVEDPNGGCNYAQFTKVT